MTTRRGFMASILALGAGTAHAARTVASLPSREPHSPGALPAGINATDHTVPNIRGNTWLPDRDRLGRVRDGNWQNLPLNRWVLVGTATLNDVVETPHLRNYYGGDSSLAITTAWCGAAYDSVNQQFYLSGGGHAVSDECENGIYGYDVPTLRFSRIRNRTPPSLRLADGGAAGLISSPKPGPSAYVCPQGDGAPGASHTRYLILYIPPETMGNINGGVWFGSGVRAIYNLDTGSWGTVHWWNSAHVASHSTGSCAALDGTDVLTFDYAYPASRWALFEHEATDYSAKSDQRLYRRIYPFAGRFSTYDRDVYCTLGSKRMAVSLSPYAGHARINYGAARDAGASNWTSYFNRITLTSADGSHADFNNTTFTERTSSTMALSGLAYDEAADCLWLQTNNIGGLLYKITGNITGAVSVDTVWNTEKIAGTGALKQSGVGTYGRMQLATVGGKKVLVRITAVNDPVQVMRIS